MAETHTTTPIAALHSRSGQNHFIQHASKHSGTIYPGGDIGSNGVEHCVFVFDEENLGDHPVVVGICSGVFSLQECLSASEARMLAKALLMAADFSEAQQHEAGRVPA